MPKSSNTDILHILGIVEYIMSTFQHTCLDSPMCASLLATETTSLQTVESTYDNSANCGQFTITEVRTPQTNLKYDSLQQKQANTAPVKTGRTNNKSVGRPRRTTNPRKPDPIPKFKRKGSRSPKQDTPVKKINLEDTDDNEWTDMTTPVGIDQLVANAIRKSIPDVIDNAVQKAVDKAVHSVMDKLQGLDKITERLEELNKKLKVQ